jgi:hypothetical protein
MRKYNDSCAAMSGSFNPFIVTADGVLAPQAGKLAVQHLAMRLTERTHSFVNTSYAVCHSARCQLGAPGAKENCPRPISFAEGPAVMPSWLYRDF